MLNINNIKTNIVALLAITLTICSAPIAIAENYTREFDEQGYLRQNRDVAELIRLGKFNSAYDHYVRQGQYQNRRGAYKTFNEQEYLRQNPDVVKAIRRGEFSSGYDHYLKYGQYENRSGVSNPSQFQQSPVSGNNWSCRNMNSGWSQEAFFRTENRLIHICRHSNSNKLAWFERTQDSSNWNNFPVEVAYNGFVNTRTGYFVNDTEFIRRRGNQDIYRERVLTKWRHNCRETSPYSSY
ncbi:MAG: hypothetical protein WBA93_05085 [Microcoleaceae cyanobacterium]